MTSYQELDRLLDFHEIQYKMSHSKRKSFTKIVSATTVVYLGVYSPHFVVALGEIQYRRFSRNAFE